jgi:hypothetical protein
MTDKPAELVQRLINAEEMSPALRRSYQAELETMLRPQITVRSALPGIVLLLILVVCIAGLVRNMFYFEAEPLVLLGWGVLALSFACAAFLIARDLWLKKHSRTSQFSISRLLTAAAGTITVVALLIGMNKPSDPASMFSAFYAFVFYVTCIAWSLDNRIAAAELAGREQMLRIECRLADLGQRQATL